MSVLLIEPDQTQASQLQVMLVGYFDGGCDLGMVRSLQEGLAYLETHPVTLTLINLILPDSSGLDAVRLIRQTAKTGAVIAYSRSGDFHSLLEAVHAGAHDVLLSFPTSAGSLSFSIQCALLRARAGRSLTTPEAQPLVSPIASQPALPPKLAHDLNNALTSINGFADILLARLPPEDSSRYCAEQIKQACAKADVLVKGFPESR